MQAIEEVRNKLHEGLYSDLFKMLIQNDRRQITATEIEAREQEKLILVGPVVERLHKELLSPVIRRTYELMRRFDHLPPGAGFPGQCAAACGICKRAGPGTTHGQHIRH